MGRVRVAPLRASPIKFSINVSDLVGHWKSGLGTSLLFYNSAGQYQGSSVTAISYEYFITPDGSFTYKLKGALNNRATNDEDSGVVELGGEFVTLKGRKYVRRYRFVNLQQALDGSTVLALWPPVDMSQINFIRDTEFWTRTPGK